MPPEITALIHRPELLIAILAVGALIGIFIEKSVTRARREARPAKRPWRRGMPGPSPRPPPAAHAPNPRDAADQLRIVMGADFTIQPLLNKSEARVFKELDRIVLACDPTWQVMAQVSLGEILRCEDASAYSCVNSKRVDLLLVDGDCQPRHAIEYQGHGHHQGTAAARDAVKREALRRAGIGYYEVVAGETTPAELRRLAEKLVRDLRPPT